VRARLLARRGESAEAERLALEAVSLAEETDMLNWQANVLADLAEVYVLSGRPEQARDRLEQAIELYEQKGNLVAAETARNLLAKAVLASNPAAT
jgi:alkanesulfonate monooxygenase SsuD/methylene tetrahydromethanopterin reductase-like flavin-dependent oxidoreductase (luciferase family)